VLEVNNITAGYGKMTILEDISLFCKDNEVIVIFGPNGAGKTTLMQTIYRFADLHHGDIRYNGIDLTKRSPHDMLRLGIGYIQQRGGFFSSMTVKDNFRMALYSHKHYKLSDKLEKIFSFFPRLEERLGQTAITLSGGEKKMLAVACVLAQDPDFLLVDEVSEGLQPQLRDEVIEVISSSAREGNKAVILVEDATESVLKMADRAYCLRDGKIVAEGPTQDFFDKATVEKLYFGEACD
jgi:branched-chain amino acid transport system ATP-binding protein